MALRLRGRVIVEAEVLVLIIPEPLHIVEVPALAHLPLLARSRNHVLVVITHLDIHTHRGVPRLDRLRNILAGLFRGKTVRMHFADGLVKGHSGLWGSAVAGHIPRLPPLPRTFSPLARSPLDVNALLAGLVVSVFPAGVTATGT